MPNWVYNTLTIEGDPDLVNQVKEQMNKPFVQHVQSIGDLEYEIKAVAYSNPVFAFWNIIAPPADKLDEYHGTHGYENGQPTGNTPYNWYNFNNREWGTKWDVAVSDHDQWPSTVLNYDEPNSENRVLVYSFNTAWGCPNEALIKLSQQYPTLLFTNEYEEETGWGGEDEFVNGEHRENASWNWMCRECDYTESNDPDENYCEECEAIRCPSCGYGEFVDDDVECQTHGVQSDSTNEGE